MANNIQNGHDPNAFRDENLHESQHFFCEKDEGEDRKTDQEGREQFSEYVAIKDASQRNLAKTNNSTSLPQETDDDQNISFLDEQGMVKYANVTIRGIVLIMSTESMGQCQRRREKCLIVTRLTQIRSVCHRCGWCPHRWRDVLWQ